MKRFQYTLLICFIISIAVGQEDIKQLKENFYSAHNEKQRMEFLFKISDHYLKVDTNLDSAGIYIEKLEGNSVIMRNNLLIAEVMLRKAQLHRKNSDFELAEVQAKKALAIFEKFNEKEKAASARIVLGNTYQKLFRNKEAIDFFLEAEKYAFEKDKIEIYVGLGSVNAQANDLEKAIYYYNKAYKLSIKLDYSKSLYNIHNGLAAIYNKNKDFDKALESFNQALLITKKNANYLGQVVCHHNIGCHYLSQEDYTNAKVSFESSIALFDHTSNNFVKANTFMNYAETLLLIGDIPLANSNLAKAETLFREIKKTGRMPRILNIRAQIEKKRGHFT